MGFLVITLPKKIGPYEVIEVLGEGGVGSVYLAEQGPPISRRVAIKLIKLGMDTREVLARFELERQAVAMMSHPNIAKVLDAGETRTGRPYFVMEYVEGKPLTEHCDEHKLNVVERLRLFVRICGAIQHAHGRGILHRDVKPSNLLINYQDGHHVPMVIDFGLAKVLSSGASEATMLTTPGQLLGTPSYMSPEQVELPPDDIDNRADVYGLGIVLFELLTGSRPHERELGTGGLPALLRNMQREESTKPSTRLTELNSRLEDVAANRRTNPTSLTKRVRGDLDWITLKATERDRERRYESVAQLKEDVELYLASQPILARPPTRAYRFDRFLRRNRIAVVVVIAAVLAMVFGSGTSTFWYLKANSSRELKEIPIRLMDQLRTNVSNAHLWFEEALAGDLSLSVEDDVLRPMREAHTSVELLRGGGETERGPIDAIRDPETAELLRQLETDLELLLSKSVERWTKRDDEGQIGGELDQAFDHLFLGILDKANDISVSLTTASMKDWRTLAKMSILMNALGLTLLLASFLITLGMVRKRSR